MIDCHLHLQDVRLSSSLEEVLATIRALGITRLVVNGTHPDDWESVASLAARVPEVIPCYGLHPWKVGTEPGNWLGELGERLRADPRAGVGEIGLDRWIKNHDLDRQREVFVAQLALAGSLGRPVTIHCLQAWGSLAESLETAARPRRFLLHSYGGPVGMIDRFVSLGAFFSISGYFFRPGKESKLAVFDHIPRDRLLVETDAPDMAPPPELVRFSPPSCGAPEPNHPGNLGSIYEAFARRLGMAVEDLVALVEDNFAEWFGPSEPGPQRPIAVSSESQRSDML
jgi:TatD DNase family protein